MAETRQAPRLDLRECVGLLEALRDNVGFSPAERETLAQALGHRSLSGPASSKLGAINHFGLIEKREDGLYQISPLGKSLLLPVAEKERSVALQNAVREPAFFEELLNHFEGERLPGMLSNILVRQFHVHDSSAEQVARVFRDSLEFAGLLTGGVVGRTEDMDPARDDVGPQLEDRPAAPTTRSDPGRSSGAPAEGMQSYTVALDGAGRLAMLQLPVPIRKADLKRLGSWVTYMSSVVEEDENPHTEADIQASVAM